LTLGRVSFPLLCAWLHRLGEAQNGETTMKKLTMTLGLLTALALTAPSAQADIPGPTGSGGSTGAAGGDGAGGKDGTGGSGSAKSDDSGCSFSGRGAATSITTLAFGLLALAPLARRRKRAH